jgi:hypothetical protein
LVVKPTVAQDDGSSQFHRPAAYDELPQRQRHEQLPPASAAAALPGLVPPPDSQHKQNNISQNAKTETG